MNEISITMNWESVKKNIFLRLVNYGMNRANIEKKAYVKFLNLAILLYCDCRKWGFDGFYVDMKHLPIWDQGLKSIFQAALENTYCKNNVFVTHINNLLPQNAAYELAVDAELIQTKTEVIVLTNKAIHFGAAMLLNITELKRLADQFGSDLYLLPSSVHEILVMCADQYPDVFFLTEMVNEVNNEVVSREDYLSDHVYHFDRKKCEVTLAVPV